MEALVQRDNSMNAVKNTCVSSKMEEDIPFKQNCESLQTSAKNANKTVSFSEAELFARRSQQKIKKLNLVLFSLVYLSGAISMFYIFSIKWQTFIWQFAVWNYGNLGNLGGCHRLWSHRSYKASLPMRIILMVGHSTNMIYPILSWARDHRIHHKYTDTDADPHNAKRGFWYSHNIWAIKTKHPETIRRGNEVDISDLLNDSVVMFEKKYHVPLILTMGLIIPTAIPVYFWNESLLMAAAATSIRLNVLAHSVSAINSVAHFYGYRPFSKSISAVQNPWVSLVTGGEGWHNYHHVFPWDYRASDGELLNVNATLLRLAERAGLVHGLKTASPELVQRVARRFGDGSGRAWLGAAPEVPLAAADDPALVDRLPVA